MKVKCFLIVKGKRRYGVGKIDGFAVRATVGKNRLDADEVAIGIELELPESIFERPMLTAKIKVPEPTNQRVITVDMEREVADILSKQVGMKVLITQETEQETKNETV